MNSLIDKGKVADKISDLFLDNYPDPSEELKTFYKDVLKIVVNEEGQSNYEQEDNHERCIQELESELIQLKKDMQENKLIVAATFCAVPSNIQDTIKRYMKSDEQPKGFKELME